MEDDRPSPPLSRRVPGATRSARPAPLPARLALPDAEVRRLLDTIAAERARVTDQGEQPEAGKLSRPVTSGAASILPACPRP